MILHHILHLLWMDVFFFNYVTDLELHQDLTLLGAFMFKGSKLCLLLRHESGLPHLHTSIDLKDLYTENIHKGQASAVVLRIIEA